MTIEEFLHFAASYDPAFTSTIRGAKITEIDALEDAAGIPLPRIYRGFLQRMGHHDGGLHLAPGSTNIDVLLAYYADVAEGQRNPPPARCILIGTNDASAGDVCLQMQGATQVRVVMSIDGELDGLYAEEFDKLLFRLVFTKYEYRQRKHAARMVGDETAEVTQKAADVALREGFKPEWFSDATTFCSQREGVVMVINHAQQAEGSITIMGDDEGTIEAIGGLLIDQAGIEFERWLK